MNSNEQLYKLSPSDFKYLWEDCKHCYYRKVISGVLLPSIGIPAVFTKMSGLLQNALQGTDPHLLHPAIPSGKFVLKEGYLKSKPIPPSGRCFINGRFDLLIEFDDGTYGVIDVKITDAKDEDLDKFDRQLHAYKFALENSATENPSKVTKISKMGLLIASPNTIAIGNGQLIFHTTPVWKEISQNIDKFFSFIQEVERVLTGPIPPISPTCGWCKYRMGV